MNNDGADDILPRPPGSGSKWSQASRLGKAVWIIKLPFRMLLSILEVLSFFVTYLLAVLPALPLRFIVPRFYWFYEGILYRGLQAFVGYWGFTAGYKVYEFGDDISEYGDKGRVLFLCNHQGMADVPTLFAVFQSKGVASRKTMWVMDHMFKWYPFGVVGQMHGDYFIRQGRKTERENEILQFRDHLREVFWDRDRRWVILFPEGGFYYKRVTQSHEYAREHGYPHPEHVTLPRIGAVKAALEEIGPRMDDDARPPQAANWLEAIINYIKYLFGEIIEKRHVKALETRPPVRYIVDATIAYPDKERPLTIQSLIFGTRESCDIAIHYKVYRADQVPYRDAESLRGWMYELYNRKDRILDNYYKTGAFVDGEVGHPIVFTPDQIVLKYVVWVSLLFLEYRICRALLGFFFGV